MAGAKQRKYSGTKEEQRLRNLQKKAESQSSKSKLPYQSPITPPSTDKIQQGYILNGEMVSVPNSNSMKANLSSGPMSAAMTTRSCCLLPPETITIDGLPTSIYKQNPIYLTSPTMSELSPQLYSRGTWEKGM